MIDLSKLPTELAAYLAGVDAFAMGIDSPERDAALRELKGEKERLLDEWLDGWKAGRDIELERHA